MYALLFGAIVVIALLLSLVAVLGRSNYLKSKKLKEVQNTDHDKKVNCCPLCGSALLKGQDLFTRVYRPMDVKDQLCTINGCPYCYPVPKEGVKRECPVCHRSVDTKSGHLVARLFNYQDKKKHVIVTGCNKCCREVQ